MGKVYRKHPMCLFNPSDIHQQRKQTALSKYRWDKVIVQLNVSLWSSPVLHIIHETAGSYPQCSIKLHNHPSLIQNGKAIVTPRMLTDYIREKLRVKKQDDCTSKRIRAEAKLAMEKRQHVPVIVKKCSMGKVVVNLAIIARFPKNLLARTRTEPKSELSTTFECSSTKWSAPVSQKLAYVEPTTGELT